MEETEDVAGLWALVRGPGLPAVLHPHSVRYTAR